MKHSEIDFGYIMIFSQFVHGMYNEKMKAVYWKLAKRTFKLQNCVALSCISRHLKNAGTWCA